MRSIAAEAHKHAEHAPKPRQCAQHAAQRSAAKALRALAERDVVFANGDVEGLALQAEQPHGQSGNPECCESRRH